MAAKPDHSKGDDGKEIKGLEDNRRRAGEFQLHTGLIHDETGAIGYIFLWLLGVPAGLLFIVFLMRGCT